MYFNANFKVFFKLKKLHLLVRKLYIYQNARCNNKNNKKIVFLLITQKQFCEYKSIPPQCMLKAVAKTP